MSRRTSYLRLLVLLMWAALAARSFGTAREGL
jgi:hypothetical protein